MNKFISSFLKYDFKLIIFQTNFFITPQEDGICKYWLNTGKCHDRDNCNFKHSSELGIKSERKNHVKTKIEKRLALQDGNHDNFVSRHQRARIFSDWIVDKFGLEKLKEGFILGEWLFFFLLTLFSPGSGKTLLPKGGPLWPPPPGFLALGPPKAQN